MESLKLVIPRKTTDLTSFTFSEGMRRMDCTWKQTQRLVTTIQNPSQYVYDSLKCVSYESQMGSKVKYTLTLYCHPTYTACSRFYCV